MKKYKFQNQSPKNSHACVPLTTIKKEKILNRSQKNSHACVPLIMAQSKTIFGKTLIFKHGETWRKHTPSP